MLLFSCMVLMALSILHRKLGCGLEYNADINSEIIIGVRASSILPMACREPAVTNDDMVGETIEVGSSLR